MAQNMPLSEEDTKLRHITPAITARQWPLEHIRMEFQITDGQVCLTPDGKPFRKAGSKGGPGERADYVLFYDGSLPLAVVEAKAFEYDDAHGLSQAIRYARMLDIPFAYSSSGKGFVERDMLNGQERTLRPDQFPTPQELWQRYTAAKNLGQTQQKVLTHRFYHEQGMNTPRYYQRIAVNRTTEAIAAGRKRVLLVMATGTGKTFTAFHIIRQLRDTGVVRKVLYLADRNCLIDQTMLQDFKPFSRVMTKVKEGEIDSSYEIFMALYQQLAGDGDDMDEDQALAPFMQVKPGFFDLVIVDECHRGSAKANSNWRRILDYFGGAIQLGLTATPKETEDISTSEYFGEAVYSYSLKQGIEDGFLAPYRVVSNHLDIDVSGVDVQAGDTDVTGRPILAEEAGHYGASDMGRSIIVDSREKKVAQLITEHLCHTDRMDKTIVFCEDTDHASRMRQHLVNLNSDMVRQNPNYVVRITGNDPDGKGQLDNFTDKFSPWPVIATTSQLLSTGVDTKTCKLVVIDKQISSMTEFKQIVGRGTRLVESHGKMYFTIMDFRGACEKFYDKEFDGDPLPVDKPEGSGGERTRKGGKKDGEGMGRTRVHIAGDEVDIAVRKVEVIGPDGKLTTENIADYTRRTVTGKYATLADFLKLFQGQARKSAILETLAEQGIDITFLREAPNCDDMDEFDLICHLAYRQQRLTRKERARRIRPEFWAKYSEPARKVLAALLDKYAHLGIGQIEMENSRDLLRSSEFSEFGGISAVAHFGGSDGYDTAVADLVQELYSAA